jgi:ABC-2 type transport system permease protein
MKLGAVFRFELAYQARRPWTWLLFASLLVFAFLLTRDASLAEALHDDFFVNSPFAVAKVTVTCSLIWLLVAGVVAGDAAARDVSTGMTPLTYTAPVSKAEYLGGRFLAALAVNAAILLAVQVGILLAVYSPGVDPVSIGPLRPTAFLTAFGYLALPNAFVATAIQFALAARSGRPMASYLGSLLLFFVTYVVATFLLFQGRGELTNLLDAVGVHFILSDLSHLWTPTEKSWRLIALEGTVLTNRLLWLGIALGTLAVGYRQFRFTHRTESSWWRRWWRRRSAAPPRPTGLGVAAGKPVSIPQAARTFGFASHLRRTFAIGWWSFRSLATTWAGLGLLVVIPALTVLVVIDQMELNGVPLVPTTIRVVEELTAPLSAELSRWVIVPLLVVFFAGELVWRERDAGMAEIVDAMPGSEWAPFVGKLLGLTLVLVLFQGLLMSAGMIAQRILGYQDFEIWLYLATLFGLQLPDYLLFALLALSVHVWVDHKYVGHLLAIAAYVFILIAALFGIEHDLLVYGAGPWWSYSDMRGFGPTLGPWLWFRLYWLAWALLLAVATGLLWKRGREGRFGARLRLARGRLTPPTVWTTAAAVGLILALGGFVFYNTNVLNVYQSRADIAARSAAYERRFRAYAGVPQPRLTATHLEVEIHPERREVEIGGSYRLSNRSAGAIDAIHLATPAGIETTAVSFDRPAKLELADEELGHQIYALGTPLQPGDSLRLDFRVHGAPRGFRESGVDTSVVANGTYLVSRDWLPAIGYQRQRELTSAAERRAHGLPGRPLIASLEDAEARQNRRGENAFEAVMATAEDQVAVAPGALRRTWTAGGRRYFHYATDGPIGDEYPLLSANYAVRQARWNDVAIRILHHPGHTAHLDRMVRSIQASLDYYSENFGPYRHRHLTVAEHPGNGTGLHAEPSMITHAEGFALWNPSAEAQSLDLPFAVMAHEMAHQWTVPYAAVEGAPVMSESVAWYYGMKAVEKARGSEQLERLRSFMREPHPYPPIHRGEPLLRGLDPYLAYRKGPFALYALSEYLGEERVNGALRRLLEAHRPEEAPLATTLDLYHQLQAVTPGSLRYLLHDLFEVNTNWELAVEQATAEQTAGGGWQVTLDLRSRKVVVDGAGVESEVPMDDWIEVGVFAPPAQSQQGAGAPLYLEKHRLRSGGQTITVAVPTEPYRAGIDPRHLLIELEPEDNVVDVETRGTGG